MASTSIVKPAKYQETISADTISTVDDEDLLQLSSDESFNEQDQTVENTALKRVAIIDTLNLIHQCASASPYTKMFKEKCEALGVLLLVRQLLMEDFDLKLFIPDSYMTGQNYDKISNPFILMELQAMGYLTTIRDHSHDDLLLLEYAKCTGGFIISNDKYRDHEQLFMTNSNKDRPSVDVIQKRVVRFSVRTKNPEQLRGGASALAYESNNGWLGMDIMLKPPNLEAMYSIPNNGDDTYGIVLNQRVLRSQRRTEKVLEKLTVICHYIRLELCEHYSVQPMALPWFNPAHDRLLLFDRFWKKYEEHIRQQEQAKNGKQVKN